MQLTRLAVWYLCSAALVLSACAPAATRTGGPTPAPRPSEPVPISKLPERAADTGTGPWSFSYTPGRYSYVIATSATVALEPDTGAKRTVPTLTQRVTVEVNGDSGTVRIVDPLVPGALDCSSPGAALAARLAMLFPKVPAHVTRGLTWTDSLSVSGCRGPVPATTSVVRSYIALGEAPFAGMTTLHVRRSDSVTGKGEGSEGQHRVFVSASGAGTTDLYLEPTSGRFVGATGEQTVSLEVTTSGRTTRFVQRVADTVSLVLPTPQ